MSEHEFSVLRTKTIEFDEQSGQRLRKNEHIDLFARVSSHMLAASDLDSFLAVALEDAGKTLSASRVHIFQCSRKRFWSLTYEWVASGITPEKDHMQKLDVIKLSAGNVFSLVAEGKPFICNSVRDISDPSITQILLKQGIQSFVAVPLYNDGKVFGCLALNQCSHIQHWSAQHTSTIIALSALINSAFAYFRSKEVLVTKRQQLYRVFDTFPLPLCVNTVKEQDVLFQNAESIRCFGEQEKHSDIYPELDKACAADPQTQLSKQDVLEIKQYYNPASRRDYKIIISNTTWEEKEQCNFCVGVDITERLRMQREHVLEQEANATKGQFIANMSHELRTPLNGIVGLTHLAEQNNTDPVVAGYLNKIKLSSDNLLSVINETLDLSEIEGDKVRLDNRLFQLADVLSSVKAILQGVVDAKGIKLEVHLDSFLPQALVGDATRLSQIIINLTNNAIKFTSVGKVIIALSKHVPVQNEASTAALHETAWIKLEVIDTGIGIPQEKIVTLFSEFSQVDSSTSRRYGGTGLGLSIVKRFVALMGGDISVSSELGVGSNFSCVLPFAIHMQSPEEKMLQKNAAAQNFDIAGVSVLLVEDNEINVLIACEVLESFGCLVETAGNGQQAVDMLDEKMYDIVLMDIQMPVLDGLEATKALRRNPRFDTLPIVAMSAHAMVQDHEKSREVGMQDHISKPFDPENLRRTIYRFAQQGFCYER